ncbi:glycosyltransferase [Novosphingobium album (ex Liu et al. 2023)]|uniref:Glycosyltransferase n=1 Tax=Novosphingobium album (ex Liu et al. 2023) TaxID=3031130 RepID=A0ABT5WLI7_9SPHN|nr:glycosyltransferase [Novosphingobium album (ex Liu et al. 2023)]MDE8650895.1 glycosyltransferase [Novosphingobium album (ex Liu et al. 2023)]
MKIVDVCALYSPQGGGIRTYVEQKLAIGPRLGHEIVIIAPGDRDEVIEHGPGARIVTLRAPHFPLDRKYWYFEDEQALHAALDAEAPDFVEVTSPWRSATMVAEWRGAAPRSLVMHADPLSAYPYRWLGDIFSRPTIDWQFSLFWSHLRRLGQSVDLVVCANRDLTRRLAEGGIANSATIPMGVEAGRFAPERRDARLRAQLLAECSLPESATLLIGVGRLAPEKRWPVVIDAVTIASREQPIGLVMLGEGREKRAMLKRIAGNPHIRLFAPKRSRDEFARILASCDALVHGCEAETFCMAAAEARACGLRVIVPDAGGAADHAASGGWTYAAGDPVAAAACIREAIERPWRPAARVRTMDEHFAELFARYEALARPFRRVA